MGRRKILKKEKTTKKQQENITPEKEVLRENLVLIEVNSLSNIPKCWMNGYDLSASDTIESCCRQYAKKYAHEPAEGWLYTNTQGRRMLLLKI